jgi:multidrug resistance efflux pump
VSDDLNGLDSRIDNRGFFERILKEHKEALKERDSHLDERFASQKEAIQKAEQRMDVILAGFPQEYAKRLEIEQMKTTADTTAKALEQKVVDSAKALAEAQDKTDNRADTRMKKMEDYQARLTGMAIIAPVVSGVVVYVLTTH